MSAAEKAREAFSHSVVVVAALDELEAELGRYKTALEEAVPEIESYVRDSVQKRARGKTHVQAVLRSLRDVAAGDPE